MQKRTPTDMTDYLEILRRRLWWVVLPAVSIALGVLFLSVKIPKTYRSETLILVDPQQVPQDFVRSTVNNDVQARLQTLSQQILSRTSLQKIIDKFSLYKEAKARLSQEDIIELMRKDVTVEIDLGQRVRERSSGAFKIAYVGADPSIVQQVTRQLASLFIEENLKVREQQAEGTSEFLDTELEKSRKNLADLEDKIKLLKNRYTGALPEQQASNLQILAQWQTFLQNNADALSRAQQQENYLQALVKAIPKDARPTGHPLQHELDIKKAELLDLQQKYSANHPDVRRAQSEVTALEASIKSSPQSAVHSMETAEGGQIQIDALRQEITERKRRQAEIEGKIRGLQGRMEVMPAVEQQFAEVNRDYQISRANYEQLLAKKNSSSLSVEMERGAKGEQFRVLDPAGFPERPYKPDLLVINVGGMVGGVMIGLMLGFLMEFRDNSIYSERDMAHYINLPVLVAMPTIMTPETLVAAKKQRLVKLALGSAAVICVGLALAYLYTHGAFASMAVRGL